MRKIIRYITIFLLVQGNLVFSNTMNEMMFKEEIAVIKTIKIPNANLTQVKNALNDFSILSIVQSYTQSSNYFYIQVDYQNINFVRNKISMMLHSILLTPLSEDCCCPKYTANMFTKTTITCSDGTNFDSGWQEGGPYESCGSDNAPQDSQECTTNTDPGDHFGVGDVTCTTCNFTKYTAPTVDSSECCEASTMITTISKAIPGEIESLANSLSGAAAAAPMIDDMEFQFSGNLSVKMGEECCLPDVCSDPVNYEEYGASISVGISVTLNIPGWDWELDNEWNGVYKIHAEISLGPEITLNPSATASATGKKFDGDCEGCLTFNLEGSIGLDVKFQGTVECTIDLKVWPYWTWSVGGHAELGVGTSITANGFYKCCTCEGKGGCVGYGTLVGYGSISFTFLGYNLSFGKSITILPGFSQCI